MWLTLMLVTTSCSPGEDEQHASAPVNDVTDSLVLESEVGHGPEPEAQFGYVLAARRSSAGRLYVLDAMSRRLAAFDSTGRHVRDLARNGEGPGEFRRAAALALLQDMPVVWDQQLWRITRFDADGQVLGMHSAPPRGETGWLPSVASAGDTWLYLDQEIESPADSGADVHGGIVRAVARLLKWKPGADWEPVAEFPGMEAALDPVAGTLSVAPFPARPLWAPAADSSFWYADSRAYRVRRITFQGDTIASIDVPREGPPVSDAAWSDFVGGRQRELSTPAARERARLPRPATLPVLQHLLSSAQGDLWLQLQPPDTAHDAEWHVYAPDGNPRYVLRIPRDVQVLSVDAGHIVTLAEDSLGVQIVRTYRLDGPWHQLRGVPSVRR
ncbi:MAG: 6-bladed beta-propeller [Gemmatimonadota bacterium]